MGDERAIIARAESADPEELASVLAAPSEEQESALRRYLGAEEFEELRAWLASRPATRKRPPSPKVTSWLSPG